MSAPDDAEAAQRAFFDRVHERFERAAERADTVVHDIAIADTVVRLAFAGPALASRFTRATTHLMVEPVANPDATICVWDSDSTGVDMPSPPCQPDRFTDRGDVWGFHGPRIKIAFHYHDFSVNLFDHERRIGIFWVRSARRVPSWTVAAPLRTIVHWWVERRGCQLVHGAAFGTRDRALLLVGAGGVGKSSTAITMLEAGLAFLGDDYVIVRNAPGPTVYGLYATAKLGAGALARHPGLADCLDRGANGEKEKAVLFLDPRFRSQLPRALPLRLIAVPRVTDGQATTFAPEARPVVEQAASFTTLAELPYADGHTRRYLADLCAALPGYRMALGRDRAAMSRAVSDLLRGPDRADRSHPAGTAPATPLVSVIIPVYNGERFVASAVRSVVAQSYRPIEIVVVDDGSTDATEAVVRALPVQRYVKQANGGPAAARNRGLREASAEYVAFLDADDVWPDEALATLMGELLRDPGAELVQGYAQVTEFVPATGTYEYRGNPAGFFPYSLATAVYRKRVFDRVGPFDETLRLGEDTDWFNRATEHAIGMKRLDALTLIVRRHSRSLTYAKPPREVNMLQVLKRSLDRKRTAAAGSSASADPGPTS